MLSNLWYDKIVAANINIHSDFAAWDIVPIIVDAMMENPNSISPYLDDVYEDFKPNILRVLTKSKDIDPVERHKNYWALVEVIEFGLREKVADAVTKQRDELLDQVKYAERELSRA